MGRVGNGLVLLLCVLLLSPVIAGASSSNSLAQSSNAPSVVPTTTTALNPNMALSGDKIAQKGAQAEASPPVMSDPGRDRRSQAPDDQGYEWRDNLENDGPEFAWLAVGDYQNVRVYNLGDDANTGAFDLGFVFPFWGREFRTIYVDTDGWMSFTHSGQDIGVSPNSYPTAVGAGANMDATIAMCNRDNTSGTDISLWTNQRDRAIIWWVGNHSYNYQLILESNGKATMQYGVNAQAGTGTVGVNMGDGRHGWYISAADANYITQGRAIAFGPPGAWLQYEGPGILVRPEALEFGNVYLGHERTIPVSITNNGAEDLEIEGVFCDDESYVLPEIENGVLGSGERFDTEVTFRPQNAGAHNVSIEIDCNAENAEDGAFFVDVTGMGLRPPDISVDPMTLVDTLFTGQTDDLPITITNDGEDDFNYTVDVEITAEPDRDANLRDMRGTDAGVGPMRDPEPAAGTLLAQFVGPNLASNYFNAVGYDQDNDIAFLTGYSVSMIYEWTHDDYANFRQVRTIGTPNPMDGAFYNGQIYLCNLNNSNVLRRFDEAGNALADISPGYSCGYGIAFDKEEGICFIHEGSGQAAIHVYQMDGNVLGQQIGLMNNWWNFDGGNANVYALEWVSKHPDGQLWINNYSTQQLYEIHVNTDTWQPDRTVRNFASALNQGYDGVVHDGHNLWLGGYQNANFRILADGVVELYWIGVDPKEGTVAGNDQGTVTVTLNAAGLNEGDYAANVTIQQDGEDLNYVVEVDLHVIGAPDLQVAWTVHDGFPDLVDWNAHYPDLFNGFDYDVVLTASNEGTADLEVDGFDFTDQDWSSPQEDGFVLGPGEDTEIHVVLNTDQSNEHECTMTIFSNDPDNNGEHEILLIANTGEPPVFTADPVRIAERLSTGESVDPVIRVTNNGEAPLRFETEIEVMSEPDRDAMHRGMRGTDRYAGPRRDPIEVDLDGMMFCVFQTNSVWGWLDDGLRQDPLLNNDNLISYRNADDFDRVNFEDYNVICISSYSQNFNAAYDRNFVRLCEYVDGGGALYYETGSSQNSVHSPGDIWNDVGQSASNGQLLVSPDPQAANYSLLAEICHTTQPNNWNVGEVIEGSSFIHSCYSHPQFQNRLDDGTFEWFQPLVSIQNSPDLWAGIAYGYGSGIVLTLGHPSAHCWFNYNQIGMWGSIGAEIMYYLTESVGAGWVWNEPEADTLEGGESSNVIVHINTTGLAAGDYLANLYFMTNDPAAAPDTIPISLNVSPAADILVEWDEEDGFPDTLNWNAHFADLYWGGPYAIPVKVTNTGVEDLEVSEFYCDNDYWIASAEEFVLSPGENRMITLTFEADESGDFRSVFHVTNNSVRDPDMVFNVHGHAFNPPEIGIEPEEWVDTLYTGGTDENNFTIYNDGDADLRWTSSVEIMDPDRDNVARRGMRGTDNGAGPMRDPEPAAGTVIAQFVGPNLASNYFNAVGYDMDNDICFITNYSPNSMIYEWTHDHYANFRQIRQFGTPSPMDGGFYEGQIYVCNLSVNTAIRRFDEAGNALPDISPGYACGYGMAFDKEEGLCFIHESSGATAIHVYQMNGNVLGAQIGLINNWWNFDGGNSSIYNLEWVSKHPDGQLWINNGSTQRAYQIHINTDTWQPDQAVSNFATAMNQSYDGLAHDGHNFWMGGYVNANFRIVADGIQERYWFNYAPDAGTIVSNQEQDVFIDLDAAGLFGGDYVADLYIYSNDPNVDRDTIVFRTSLHVIPVGDIVVEWDPGFDDNVIDWNLVYGSDLYAGGGATTYPIPVTISNEGTEDIEINDVFCDDGEFTTDWNPDTQGVVGPDESFIVHFYFQSDVAGEFVSTVIIESSDPDEGEFEIPVQGVCSDPPRISLSEEAIVDSLVTGDINEHQLFVINDGDTTLRWKADIEITQEVGRDAELRGMRGTESTAGPRRDPEVAGTRLLQFQGGVPANQYKNGCWDYDDEWLIENQYNSPYAVYIYNPSDNYRLVRTWNMGAFNPMDIAYMDGIIYQMWLWNPTLKRYDMQGHALADLALQNQVGINGVATSPANQVILACEGSGDPHNLNVFNLQGVRIAQVGSVNPFVNNTLFRSIEWVDKHPDGELWVSCNGRAYQIDVDVDNWRFVGNAAVNSFATANANEYGLIAHDGHNMYMGEYATQMIDLYTDGVVEVYWIGMEPMDGVVESGEDQETFVTLNGTGLYGGDYAALINFYSNDPVHPDDSADVVLPVNMHVTGMPDITVEWPARAGFPNLVDWNTYFGANFYAGGPYPIPVTIANDGTDDLEITDIGSDNGVFTTDWDPDRQGVIGAGEEITVHFIFEAEQADLYESTIFIEDNDPNEEEASMEILVRGECSNPPRIDVTGDDFENLEDGLIADLFTGDQMESRLVIANTGDTTLNWEAEIEMLDEAPGQDAVRRGMRGTDAGAGPMRDPEPAAGTVIAQFNGPNVANQYFNAVGYDFDNDICFITNYSPNSMIYEWTHDNYANFRQVRQFGTPSPMDGGFYEGQIYVCNLNNSNVIRRFDEAGNAFADISPGYSCGYGMAFDKEEGLCFIHESSGATAIHVYRMNGNVLGAQIGLINNWWNFNGANSNVYSLEWVPKHPDGQLWIPNYSQQRIYQIHVNTDTWQPDRAVSNFATSMSQGYDCGAHDGHNFWMGGYANANFRIVADGIQEIYWIAMDPMEGAIASDNEAESFITLDATGLLGGHYYANVNFFSNDPIHPDGVADAVLPVDMHVTGVPDIDTSWAVAAGYPDMVDWNGIYGADLYAGGPYPIPITISNDGTDDLEIDDIGSDNAVFSSDWNPDTQGVVGAGEHIVVNFIFNAAQAGLYESTMFIISNDPSEGEGDIEILVRGQCSNPPRIALFVNDRVPPEDGIVDTLFTGDTHEWALNVANEGDTTLNWTTDVEVISEPGRDATVRGMRGTDHNAGPRRDPAPEGTYALFQDAVDFGWVSQWVFGLGAVQGIDYHNYTNAADLINAPLDDYDVIWVETGDMTAQFTTNWNQNVGRFEEWVSHGGVMFIEQGWNGNHVAVGIGGLVDVRNPQEARLADGLGRGGNQENWLVDQMGWAQRQAFPGGSTLHCVYPIANLNNIEDCDFYQVIAVGATDSQPGIIWYTYGRGNVIVSGSPCGHQWQYHAVNQGEWGTCGPTMLHWMGEVLAKPQWLMLDTEEGSLERDEDQDVFLTLTAAELLGGHYIANVNFLSNDPIHPADVPDIVLPVDMLVIGMPDLEVEWAEAAGFPDLVDWNGIYGAELYAGGPYPIAVTISNAGTDDLEINDIGADDGTFTTDWNPDNQSVIGPGDDITIHFIFNAANPGLYESTIFMETNDPNEDEALKEILVRGQCSNPPRIAISGDLDPDDGIVDTLYTGDINEYQVTVTNDGDTTLNWTAEIEMTLEPERDAVHRGMRGTGTIAGPTRDPEQAGTRLLQFQGGVPANQYKNGCWDYDDEWLIENQYNSPYAVYIYNPSDNYRLVRTWNMGAFNPMDLAYMDGIIYQMWLWNPTLKRYDMEGHALADLALQNHVGINGVATSPANQVILACEGSGDPHNLNVFNLQGVRIAALGSVNPFVNNTVFRSIDFVDKHPDGELWVNTNNRAYQIDIDVDNWRFVGNAAVNSFATASGIEYGLIAHDGHNLYVSEYATQMIDYYTDGVEELYWIGMEPMDGVVEAGEEMDAFVTLNATHLAGGDYGANVNFISNDPVQAGENPDYVLPISMHVFAVADIDVAWDEGAGYIEQGNANNVVDWNGPGAYGDRLYTGGDFVVPVTIANQGTDDLEISEVSCEAGEFSTNWNEDNQNVLGPDESFSIDVTFNADEADEYFADLIIVSSDPNEGELAIPLHADAHEPPLIELSIDPEDGIVDSLLTGQVHNHALMVRNVGDANLHWEADIVEDAVPERDANRRGMRGTTKTVGPTRDDINVEDVLDMHFAVLQTVSNWGWLDEGFRQDPLLRDNITSYRNAADWDNIVFEDFDAVIVAGQDGCWTQNFANNFGRFTEYIADGGCAYYEMADANSRMHTPGNFVNDIAQSSSNGILAVSPNPNDEDYSFFAEICHTTQPNNWLRGEVIEGSAWLHAGIGTAQFDAAMNNGAIEWYQVIAVQQDNQNNPGAIAYGLGKGTVMMVSHPVGHCWFNYNQIGMWGSVGAEILYYLTEMGGAQWISMEPTDGMVVSGEEQPTVITIDATGANGGDYLAHIDFYSDDPTRPADEPDVTLPINVHIEGAAVFSAEPQAFPEMENASIDFGDLFVNAQTSMTVTITNAGTEAFVVSGYDIDGDNADDFATDLPDDDVVFDPGDEHDYTFTFQPSDPGDRMATVHVFCDARNLSDNNGEASWMVHGRGLIGPEMTLDPADNFFASVLRGDEIQDETLTMSNAAGDDRANLDFSIISRVPDNQRDQIRRSMRSTGADLGPIRDRRGGPDDMGYEWRDNLEGDGPEFEWLNVADYQGVRVFNMGDDQNSGAVDIGFNFPLWNRVFRTVYCDTDGWMSFTYGGQDIMVSAEGYPAAVANGAARDATIAMQNGDNLNGTDVWVWTNRQDQAIIWWSGNHTYQYQLILNANGLVLMQYGLNAEGRTGTVGVNLGDGRHGWYLSAGDANYVRNGRVIGFGPAAVWGVPWLTIDPMEGSIPAGESQDITLGFNPSGLDDGDYNGDLVITTNEPGNEEVTYPIVMEVGDGMMLVEHYTDFDTTDANHSVLVTAATFEGDPLPRGWEIGVFSPAGVLSGASVWLGRETGIAVWGSDGHQISAGEMMSFRFWDPLNRVEWRVGQAVPENGDLRWAQNGVSFVTLGAVRGRDLVVPLRVNWNLISINITPGQEMFARQEGPNIVRMMAQLDRGQGANSHLILMKDELGHFYSPDFPFQDIGFNNIPYWNLAEGYQVRMDQAMNATWTGTPIDPQADVPIGLGWNMIAYFPDYPLASSRPDFLVISPIRDLVVIAKDGDGRFMVPSRNFSGMVPWHEGLGYQINVTRACTLNYPLAQQEGAALALDENGASKHWIGPVPTGANMSVLVSKVSGVDLTSGDQVAAFNARGDVVGVGSVIDGMIGIAVWGDDPSTKAVEGLANDEQFTLKLFDADKSVETPLEFNATFGPGLTYTTDEFTVGDASLSASIPTEFYMSQNYPNPFNAVTRLAFGLPENSHVSINVFDVSGRQVASLLNGDLRAGNHVAVWNGAGVTSGIYIVKMQAAGFSQVRKVTLVK